MATAPSLSSLYTACAPLAYRRARRLLDDEGEAWDVVHEVFERLARDPGAIREGDHPMRYIYRATVNTCINRWKARRVRHEARVHLERPELSDSDPGSVTEARQLLAALWDRLDDTGRAILVLRYVDGLPQEEVADVLGLWRRTVGRRLDQIRSLAGALGQPTGAA